VQRNYNCSSLSLLPSLYTTYSLRTYLHPTTNMSDAPKVEEPVAPRAAEAPVAEPVAETKAEETPAAAEAATETPALESTPAPEETPAKEEVKPVEEGVLGYKGPGLLK
jgi:hypothetical protein